MPAFIGNPSNIRAAVAASDIFHSAFFLIPIPKSLYWETLIQIEFNYL